jgi:hypothetical protein
MDDLDIEIWVGARCVTRLQPKGTISLVQNAHPEIQKGPAGMERDQHLMIGTAANAPDRTFAVCDTH